MRWFRFYSDALDDPKVQRLPGDLFKIWVNLLCLANEGEPRGALPDLADIAFRLRLSESETGAALADLQSRGLIDLEDEALQPHNWDGRQRRSDDVTARVQKHRAKREEPVTGNVTETPQIQTRQDTETETDESSSSAAAAPTEKPERRVFSHDSDEYRLARVLAAHIQRNNPKARAPTEASLQRWARDARLMIHTDGRDPTDIRRVLDWCQHDSFWLTNILSIAKLREKFDELWLKMERAHERQPAGATRGARPADRRSALDPASQTRPDEGRASPYLNGKHAAGVERL